MYTEEYARIRQCKVGKNARKSSMYAEEILGIANVPDKMLENVNTRWKMLGFVNAKWENAQKLSMYA